MFAIFRPNAEQQSLWHGVIIFRACAKYKYSKLELGDKLIYTKQPLITFVVL